MSKILVTGSEGYIGSKLCVALKELGHQVIRVDNVLGITVSNSYFRDVDLIYHLAAQTDVQYSNINPYFDAINNIGTTIELIKKYPGIKIIYPASAASQKINSPYGLSKRVGAEYIKLLCKEYVICMLGNIWGDGGHGAIDKFKERDVIQVNGDGHQTRTITHVRDVVKGLVKAMNWETGEYVFGGKFDMSIKQIAEKIAKDMGKEVFYNLGYNPEKEGEVFAATIPNTTPDWEAEIEL